MLKVGIIGAGPAGLITAIECAVSGIEVTLYEKNRVGENINCAEGFFDTMKLLGEPSQGVLCSINALEISINENYTIDCSNLNLWMIDRKSWQQGLKKQAESRGVNILEHTPISSEDLTLMQNEFDWIVDCSGIPSVTSRCYGFQQAYKSSWAYAHQLTVEHDFTEMFGKLRAGVRPNFLGYFWIFPKSKTMANIGLGIYPENRKYPENIQTSVKQELEKVLQELGLADARILTRTGGVIPTYPLDNLKYNNILLAGDSGGFASPLHGGGIDMAIISAKEAAKSIKTCQVENYSENVKDLLLPKIDLEKKVVEIWEALGYAKLDRLMRLILKRENYSELPSILKYQPLLLREKEAIEQFINGFFYGNWPVKTIEQ